MIQQRANLQQCSWSQPRSADLPSQLAAYHRQRDKFSKDMLSPDQIIPADAWAELMFIFVWHWSFVAVCYIIVAVETVWIMPRRLPACWILHLATSVYVGSVWIFFMCRHTWMNISLEALLLPDHPSLERWSAYCTNDIHILNSPTLPSLTPVNMTVQFWDRWLEALCL